MPTFGPFCVRKHDFAMSGEACICNNLANPDRTVSFVLSLMKIPLQQEIDWPQKVGNDNPLAVLDS
jgi:hypothetical protein